MLSNHISQQEEEEEDLALPACSLSLGIVLRSIGRIINKSTAIYRRLSCGTYLPCHLPAFVWGWQLPLRAATAFYGSWATRSLDPASGLAWSCP
jgi:hypothetical protein